MREFEIVTPRGVKLAGELIRPVDASDAVLVMVHSFLEDRRGGGRFDAIGRLFRGAGYATCSFDFSGSGKSDDAPITIADQQLDLRAVCNWLEAEGLTRQAVFAYGFGTKVALSARPRSVKAIICADPLLVSRTVDWSQVFSEQQLQELDQRGQTVIEDDLNPQRVAQIVSKQTLIDLSHTDAAELLDGLTTPVLFLIGAGAEDASTLAASQETFHLLADGSRVITLPAVEEYAASDMAERIAEHDRELAEQALRWLQPRVPAHAE